MKLSSAAYTDVGRVRKNNQDSYLCHDQLKLYVVADGLGGHQGGEVASKMAKDFLLQVFSATKRSFDPSTYLINAIKEANRKIYDRAASTANLKGMGTTLTVLYFSFDTAYIAHVGDSRAYLIVNDMIWQLSQDHTLVSQQFDSGVNVPLRNVLTRSVGFDPEVEVDLYTKKVSKGETYLLCSDGLHGLINDNEIAQTIGSKGLSAAPKALVALANQRGGEDNITAVVTQIERV